MGSSKTGLHYGLVGDLKGKRVMVWNLTECNLNNVVAEVQHFVPNLTVLESDSDSMSYGFGGRRKFSITYGYEWLCLDVVRGMVSTVPREDVYLYFTRAF